MKLTEIKPNIYQITFKTQKQAATTFIRLQEFYESPLKGIKGKYFTIDEYAEKYAEKFGNFTYYEDWGAFNVPGHIVKKFYNYIFLHTLSKKENALLKLLAPIMKKENKFYVIGIYNKKDVKHEIAHALYYLNRSYRKEITELLYRRGYNRLEAKLLKMGYLQCKIPDEMQAYLSTSTLKEYKQWFGTTCIYKEEMKLFKKVFKKYYEKM